MYRGRITLATPMLWFLGFVATFTVGGVAGGILSVPPADFQLHNSLFLVAHFHTMIIGGAVFGYFAGVSYWFPKIFGFRLNERLGKYAFWCWLVGFLLAFVPLYILGLMGATRRLDHYDASMGWQGLFIVAAVGVAIILLGVGFQLLQLFVSILKRHENRDLTGDPWDARTLEWSVPSPAPEYNFATLPTTTERDAFWEHKHGTHKLADLPLEPIRVPKNSGLGVIIALFAFIFGFGAIWHMWWLLPVGLVGIIVCIFIRTSGHDHERTISVRTIERHLREQGKAAV
jgi:cytochrome o ubiquinol oxidase subunit 1